MIESHYRENFDTLIKRLTKAVGSEMEAEDVIQNAYENCLKYRKTFYGNRDEFDKWFSVILRNCVAKFKNEKKLEGMTTEFKEKKGEGMELPVGNYRVVTRVESIVSKERPLVREIYRLHINHGLPLTEVSELVTVTYGTVRKEVSKLKHKIREKIGE